MPKIPIEDIESILNSRIQDPTLLALIRQDLTIAAEANQPVPREPDAGDKRCVTLLLCGEEDVQSLREYAERITALTFQIDAENDHHLIPERILAGAAAFNATKRRGGTVSNLAEACDAISPKKHLDSFPKRIYTKEPALVIVSTNLEVPRSTPAPEGGE